MTIYFITTQGNLKTAIVQAYTLKKAKQLFIDKIDKFNVYKKELKIKSKRIGYTDFKTGKKFTEKIIYISN